jgi:outer membrane protein
MTIMTRFLQLSLTLLLLSAATAFAQPLKIGFINGFRIESESELTKRAIEQLKKEFAPREQQIQDMQKQGLELKAEFDREAEKMKPADRQLKEKRLASLAQQFEQLQRSYAEDMEFRQREARQRIVVEINAIVTAIAEAEKYDLILQQVIYATNQIDLTDRVLKEMAKRVGTAPR